MIIFTKLKNYIIDKQPSKFINVNNKEIGYASYSDQEGYSRHKSYNDYKIYIFIELHGKDNPKITVFHYIYNHKYKFIKMSMVNRLRNYGKPQGYLIPEYEPYIFYIENPKNHFKNYLQYDRLNKTYQYIYGTEINHSKHLEYDTNFTLISWICVKFKKSQDGRRYAHDRRITIRYYENKPYLIIISKKGKPKYYLKK